MKTKASLAAAALYALCAVIWWLNALKDGGLSWLSAALWTAVAVIYGGLYVRLRKDQQNSDIMGGNENE